MPRPSTPKPSPSTTREAARRWFLRPPRAHGEQLEDRTVGNLELLYDLVFVVFVSQIAEALAADVSWRAVVDNGVLFCLLWLLWFNGSSYHELHAREDGRARGLIFTQMGLLSLLAVYAEGAPRQDGHAFAWTLTALLAVQTYQWYSVQRIDDPIFRPFSMRYLAILAAGLAIAAASALVASDDLRMVLWAVLSLGLGGAFVVVMVIIPRELEAFHATESLVERFALFTIIVLGEVVVSVVDGLRHAERDFLTDATGVIALCIGFGFWWTYFDLVGRREPRQSRGATVVWMFAHLPVAAAITAAGAGMVGLVDHAHDARTPAPAAWLLAGSVALLLVTIVGLMQTLADHHRLEHLHRPLAPALLVAAVAVLVIGALHPVAWLLALLIVLVLSGVWWLGFLRVAGSPGGLPGD